MFFPEIIEETTRTRSRRRNLQSTPASGSGYSNAGLALVRVFQVLLWALVRVVLFGVACRSFLLPAAFRTFSLFFMCLRFGFLLPGVGLGPEAADSLPDERAGNGKGALGRFIRHELGAAFDPTGMELTH